MANRHQAPAAPTSYQLLGDGGVRLRWSPEEVLT